MTNNQKLFCQEYVKSGSNAKQAYLKVYKCKDESAEASGIRLLGNVKVQEYISSLQEKVEDKSIMAAKERMEWLTNVVKGLVKNNTYDGNGSAYENEAHISDKMKAIDLLNKMDGQYVENINLKGKIETNPYTNLSEEELRKLSNG